MEMTRPAISGRMVRVVGNALDCMRYELYRLESSMSAAATTALTNPRSLALSPIQCMYLY